MALIGPSSEPPRHQWNLAPGIGNDVRPGRSSSSTQTMKRRDLPGSRSACGERTGYENAPKHCSCRAASPGSHWSHPNITPWGAALLDQLALSAGRALAPHLVPIGLIESDLLFALSPTPRAPTHPRRAGNGDNRIDGHLLQPSGK